MRLPRSSAHRSRGFTLIETILGMTMFVLIGVTAYNSFSGLIKAITASRAQLTAAELLTEQVEIVRNLPFSSVGVVSGIPSGILTATRTVTRGGLTFTVTTTVHNYDDTFDGTVGGTPNDLNPADYKLVQIDVLCTNCPSAKKLSFTTVQAPKTTEGTSTNGSLIVQVLNAVGLPIPDATLHVVRLSGSPAVDITDVTDNEGKLKLYDVPPGVQNYKVTASMSGLTTDSTTTISGGNPSPTKPDATVVAQTATSLSLSIDTPGNFNITSVTNACVPVASVPFTFKGAKLIGTPSVYKYNASLTTDGTGALALTNMDWDSYSVTLGGSTYDLGGTIPASPVALSPAETQNLQLITVPHTTTSMLVTVLDGATQLPVTDASVTLTRNSSPNYSATFNTDQGYLAQTDWSGGSGQANFTNATKYFSDSNVDVTGTAGDVKLKKTCSGSKYCTPGYVISSTFDMGGPVDYRNIFWGPVTQPSQAGSNSVQIQIATNNDNSTWNFVGPDGTGSTYYTTTNTAIRAAHDTDRYLRYKLHLKTSNTSYTPNVSDVSFTYTASCAPPGQVIFTGLTSGTFTLGVTKSGYSSYSNSSTTVSSGWQMKTVTLNP